MVELDGGINGVEVQRKTFPSSSFTKHAPKPLSLDFTRSVRHQSASVLCARLR